MCVVCVCVRRKSQKIYNNNHQINKHTHIHTRRDAQYVCMYVCVRTLARVFDSIITSALDLQSFRPQLNVAFNSNFL